MTEHAATPTELTPAQVLGILAKFDRRLTVGAMEIGNQVATLFLGLVLSQAFHYFRNFPKDPFHVKAAVGTIITLNLVLTALLWRLIYFYTIDGPCNPLALDHVHISLTVAVPILGVIALIVQTMYCLRVWRIVESIWLAIGCWLFVLARFAMFVHICYIASDSPSLHVAVETPRFKSALVACLVSGAVADIAICICITMGLLKRRTGFTQTDALIDKLLAYTIGSGLLPTVVSVSELIAYVTMQDKFVWLAFWMVMAQALCASLLSSLNQRTPTHASEHSLSSGVNRTGGNSAMASGNRFQFDKVHQVSGISMELSSVQRSDAIDDPYRGGYQDKREEFDSDRLAMNKSHIHAV
ncbi:hypothetical protein BKA62DRAFT_191846 [Auriculariales sp. MPI-PUGE-AT-0066]|nr:hypothetical protein BKA62DRAFT_191846 [Auriculariales sp. MPI-PUGE-AT-0066]